MNESKTKIPCGLGSPEEDTEKEFRKYKIFIGGPAPVKRRWDDEKWANGELKCDVGSRNSSVYQAEKL